MNNIKARLQLAAYFLWKHRKYSIPATIVLCFLIGWGIAAIYRFNHAKTCTDCASTATENTVTAEETPVPTPPIVLAASRLNGSPVADSSANQNPLAVMIENHPDARPQAGLGSAGLVYEAMAEGGITRFMAVFADRLVSVKVGPIRSARTYYVDFATELRAFYAHVGGNLNALNQIKATSGFYDMDQFAIGAPTFERDLSKNVALEHTMYSSTTKLWDLAINNRKWSSTASFEPWLFKDDAAAESRPANQTVTVNFSSASFKVVWHYLPESNHYTREMGGTGHKDANTNELITAKTIVLQTVNRSAIVTAINEHGWKYDLTGSGKATVIQDGIATSATWKKEGTGRTRYYDANNQEISFNKGPIWVEIVHPDTATTIE